MNKSCSHSECGGPAPGRAVFVDTSLDTHLAAIVSDSDTVDDFKKKIQHEHHSCFPHMEKIKVHALMVERKKCLYHLSDSMFLRSAFEGVSESWFIFANASSKEGHIGNSHSSRPDSGNLVACLDFRNHISSAHVVDLLPDGPSRRLSNIDDSLLPQVGNMQHGKHNDVASEHFTEKKRRVEKEDGNKNSFTEGASKKHRIEKEDGNKNSLTEEASRKHRIEKQHGYENTQTENTFLACDSIKGTFRPEITVSQLGSLGKDLENTSAISNHLIASGKDEKKKKMKYLTPDDVQIDGKVSNGEDVNGDSSRAIPIINHKDLDSEADAEVVPPVFKRVTSFTEKQEGEMKNEGPSVEDNVGSTGVGKEETKNAVAELKSLLEPNNIKKEHMVSGHGNQAVANDSNKRKKRRKTQEHGGVMLEASGMGNYRGSATDISPTEPSKVVNAVDSSNKSEKEGPTEESNKDAVPENAGGKDKKTKKTRKKGSSSLVNHPTKGIEDDVDIRDPTVTSENVKNLQESNKVSENAGGKDKKSKKETKKNGSSSMVNHPDRRIEDDVDNRDPIVTSENVKEVNSLAASSKNTELVNTSSMDQLNRSNLESQNNAATEGNHEGSPLQAVVSGDQSKDEIQVVLESLQESNKDSENEGGKYKKKKTKKNRSSILVNHTDKRIGDDVDNRYPTVTSENVKDLQESNKDSENAGGEDKKSKKETKKNGSSSMVNHPDRRIEDDVDNRDPIVTSENVKEVNPLAASLKNTELVNTSSMDQLIRSNLESQNNAATESNHGGSPLQAVVSGVQSKDEIQVVLESLQESNQDSENGRGKYKKKKTKKNRSSILVNHTDQRIGDDVDNRYPTVTSEIVKDLQESNKDSENAGDKDKKSKKKTKKNGSSSMVNHPDQRIEDDVDNRYPTLTSENVKDLIPVNVSSMNTKLVNTSLMDQLNRSNLESQNNAATEGNHEERPLQAVVSGDQSEEAMMKGVEKEMLAEKQEKKHDALAAGALPDLQCSVKSFENQGDSQIANCNPSQPERSSLKGESDSLMLQSMKKVSGTHSHLGEETKAPAASTCSLESSRSIVNKKRRGNEHQSHGGSTKVTIRKESGNNIGEVVDRVERKNGLLVSSGAIFKDDGETSTRTPSDKPSASNHADRDSDANFISSPNGSYHSEEEDSKGNTRKPLLSSKIPLPTILRRSKRYKKAKLIASQLQLDDTESQPVEFVPDSQAC